MQQPKLEKRNPDTDGHYRWTELIDEAFDELVYNLRLGLARAAEGRPLHRREDSAFRPLIGDEGQMDDATVAAVVAWTTYHAISEYLGDGVELSAELPARVERYHAVLAALAPYALGCAVEQVLAERAR